MTKKEIEQLVALRLEGKTWVEISSKFSGQTPNALRKRFYREVRDNKAARQFTNPPKILVLDIETLPIISYTWGTFDQNVALNQIKEDWSILSYAAKFLGSDKIFYGDVRNEKNVRNDKKLLADLWELLDQADIVLGQNSKRFDVKKIKARLILNGFTPPSSFRQIDTMILAKRHFAFTSNKLEYMTKNLCTTNKKISHAKFGGFELWKACMEGNKEAYKELREYNVADILSTEELFFKLAPWDSSINLSVYSDNLDFTHRCFCGSEDFKKHGFVYSNSGKFQRFICNSCGNESRSSENLLIKEKRKSLRK